MPKFLVFHLMFDPFHTKTETKSFRPKMSLASEDLSKKELFQSESVPSKDSQILNLKNQSS
jgi:hypothetical protein